MYRPDPWRLAAAGALLLSLFARPGRPAERGLKTAPAAPAPPRQLGVLKPPGGVRKELVGIWRCPDTWMVERSGGRGPTALKLKDSGVYVLLAKPKGKKQEFREYGHWTADDSSVYMDQEWFQVGEGKLVARAGKGRYLPRGYALAPNGSSLTFRGEKFAKIEGAVPAGATAGPATAPATLGAGPIDVNDLAVVSHRPGVLRVLHSPFRVGRNGKSTYTVQWKAGDGDAVTGSGSDQVMTITAAGKRTVTAGYYLESVSPDCRLVYLSKPNQGIWAMHFPSGSPRRLTSEPLGYLQPSASGAYLTGATGWKRENQTWFAGADGGLVVLTASGKRLGATKGIPGDWLAHDTRLVLLVRGERGRDMRFLVDVAKGLPVLCGDLRNTFSWFPSDSQKWWMGQSQSPNQAVFVRVADGKRFDHVLPPGDYMGHQWSGGDRYVRLVVGKDNALLAPDSLGTRPMARGAFFPWNGAVVDRLIQSSPHVPSPDGRLLAVYDQQEIEIFDADDPTRVFHTGIKPPDAYALRWIAPNVLRYDGSTAGLIVFGKKAAALSPSGGSPGGEPAATRRLAGKGPGGLRKLASGRQQSRKFLPSRR